MANPLTTSDFYKHTDELQKLIKDLNEANNKIEEMRKKEIKSANALASAVSGLKVVTSEQREEVAKSSKQADEIKKRYDKLSKSYGSNAIKIAGLKEEQRKLNLRNKLEAKLLKAKKGSYDQLSASYSLNTLKLNQMTEEEIKGTEEGKELEEQTKKIREEMIKKKEAVGNTALSVGDYAKALGPLGAQFNRVSGAMKAFLRNPILLTITAIVGALAALKKSLSRSEEGQDRLNKVMRIAGSVVDNVLDIVTALAIALFDVFPNAIRKAGNIFSKFTKRLKIGFKGAQLSLAKFLGQTERVKVLEGEIRSLNNEMSDLKKTGDDLNVKIGGAFDKLIDKAKNFGSEVSEDIKKAEELAALEARLNRAERKILVENARLTRKSNELRAEAEKLKKQDAETSLAALQEAFEFETKAAENSVRLAKVRADVLRRQSALAADDIEAKREIAQAEAEIENARAGLEAKRRERERSLNFFRLEAFKQENDRRKNQMEILKLSADLEISKNKEIISSTKETADEKILAAGRTFAEVSKLAEESFEIEKARLDKELELNLKSRADYLAELELLEKKRDVAIEKGERERLKIIEKINAERLKAAERAKKLAEAERKAARSASLKEFDDLQKLERSKFDLLKHGEQEKTKFRLEMEKARLEKILDLNKEFEDKLSEVQIETIRNTIKKIDNEIGALGDKGGGPRDIYDLLGFKLDDEQKSGITESIGFVKEQFSGLIDSRIKLADKGAQAANQAVEEAQRALQIEIEKREQGLDNEADVASRRLEMAKENQNKALEEQRKAQRAQARLQTLEQTANMVTATSKIWASFSGLGPLGPALAIAAIATMWGSFIASKVRAAQLSKKKFGKGGLVVLGGGSHASGNDTPLGFQVEGKDAYGERGETHMVLTPKQTRQSKGVMPEIYDALKRGEFEDRYEKRVLGNSVSDNDIVIASQGAADMSRTERELGYIRKQGERRYYTNEQGKMVMEYKNRTTTYV